MASSSDVTHSKRPHVKTERMQEFIRSQDSQHSPTKKHKCPQLYCNKEFTSIPGLKYHLQTHSLKDPQFSCKRCLKFFKSANGLKYHREKTKCDDTDLQGQWEADTKHNQGCAVGPPRRIPECLSLGTVSDMHVDRGMDKLTELAIIATSPQSPLMQKPKPPWEVKPSAEVVRSLEKLLEKGEPDHSDDEVEGHTEVNCHTEFKGHTEVTGHTEICSSAHTQVAIATEGMVENRIESTHVLQDSIAVDDTQISSTSPLCVSPDHGDMCTDTWSHTWPTPVWQCFIKGTKVKFLSEVDSSWQLVETIARTEELAQQARLTSAAAACNSYSCDGFCILNIREGVDGIDLSDVLIHFIPIVTGQSEILAHCQRDHPFYVRDKGWSSLYPQQTAEHYGIPCSVLAVGDVCLPPSHTDTTFSEEMYKSLEEYEFTAEDTSAVLALSTMKQRKDTDYSPHKLNPRHSPKHEHNVKRPMNAFMLYAKDFRLQFTQKFPKRDNRAISVMLGEKWKTLPVKKKKIYEHKAKLLAEKQKEKYPDCWKQKK